MIAGHEGQQMAFDNDETLQQQLDFITSSSVPAHNAPHHHHSDKKSYEHKCDNKNCNVGRNKSKRSSWFRQKIHFVDVSKLRQPKLCMKTHLVGDDCKPLLIKAGEDVTVPLVSVEQQKKEFEERQKEKMGNSGHCGKCGLLLDALARTFCLPLLG